MKKYAKFGWVALLFAVLVLAGCGAKNQNQNQNENQSGASNSVTETVKQGLYGLMTAGTGAKCTIEDPQSGNLTMYAKGDKAKVEGFPYMPMSAAFSGTENGQPPKQETGTMINDGTWAYMWSGTEGIKFNVKEMEAMGAQNQSQVESQQSASDWKDWVKDMDEKGVKYDCDAAVLTDSDFKPPANVKFEDWGEMLKGFMKMGEEMKNKMPSQGTPPGQ